MKELRSCYSDMIDRVEGRLLETLGIDSYDYSEYVEEIRKRLAHVKEYLLTDRLKEFYQHVMAEFDNRNEWYQSISIRHWSNLWSDCEMSKKKN